MHLTGRLICALFLILLLAAPGAQPAEAQAAGLVRVAPETAWVEAGGTVSLTLELLGAQDVNAYDLTLRYDPAVVTLVSWSHGGFLSNLAQVYRVEEPGTLRLVFTQLATPPVSGDGILLNLVFGGMAPGETPLSIEKVEFAGSSGIITHPELQDGWLSVLPAPEASPTPAVTLTPAATLAPTLGPTATLTAEQQPAESGPLPTRVNLATAEPSRTPTQPAESAASAPAGDPAAPTPQTLASPGVFLPAVEHGQTAAEEADAGRDYRLINALLWILLVILVLAVLWMAAKLVQRQKRKS